MKYLILDGNSILNRAFYGIKALSNKKGQMTNAIYGFLLTFEKLKSEINPDAIAVAFDLPNPTFRHKIFEGYKSNRKKMPEELVSQLKILKDLLIALGYKLVMCEGYEADDILGTFGRYCEENDYECVIATGDRDSLQLISSNVFVRIAKTKFGKPEAVFYDEQKVREDYGVLPQKLIDIKALQGDTSDNIPGVKGIGEKTAKDLVQKFGGIEKIYENLENLDIKSNIKEKLKIGKESAFMSYELGKIDRYVPIQISDHEFFPSDPDIEKSREILTELEFFAFMEKYDFLKVSREGQIVDLKVINSFDDALKFIENLKSQDAIAVQFVKRNSEISSIVIAVNDEIFAIECSPQNLDSVLVKILSAKPIKIVYDLKDITKLFKSRDLNFTGGVFDVLLAAYLLNPSLGHYDLERIAEERGIAVAVNFGSVDSELCIAAKRARMTSKLYAIQKKELEERNQIDLLVKIEQPLANVLANMELTGFLVDKSGIESYGAELGKELREIQTRIYNFAGMEFNINSPKQLAFVLFEKLNLPRGKKGKTGYSTSAATLEKLKGMHEIIDLILEYRTLSKLKSTYCDGMLRLVSGTGRLHSAFNQIETRTGRISSTEPNLQNIPVRTKQGRKLRKFFKASENCVLIDADYSQIELRVMAHISGDKNMTNAFKEGQDVHAITASQILGVPVKMVTPEMRFKAKAVNFGILYGMGAFSLAEDLKISRFEAQNYINRYLSHYSGIDKFMQDAIESAKIKGYAETIFHRRRYLPELESPNYNLRSFGERVARNMPIQGSAADIIKIAMINVFNHLEKRHLKAKLILQVHDELIIESPESEAEEVTILLKTEMENAVKMAVPLEVHIATGKTWYDAKD